DGLGARLEVDLDAVIPDKNLTLNEHAIAPWKPISSQYYPSLLKAVCDHYGIDMDTPVKDLPPEHLDIILYGSRGEKIRFYYVNEFGNVHDTELVFEGGDHNIDRRYHNSISYYVREQMEQYMVQQTCPTCKGNCLKKEALAVKISGKHIGEVTDMQVREALEFFENLELTKQEKAIARLILREIRNRLGFLVNVGLDYLTLSRSAGTLSGGEAQRI